MSDFILTKKIIITGKIKLLTGLHIGGTNTSLSIGAIDKAVIRDPITRQPIIPGSSLKGKMRSLIELQDGSFNKAGSGKNSNGASIENCKASRLFGVGAGAENSRPSRLIVRDAYLCKEQGENKVSIDDFFKDTALLYSEAKTEVNINRITSEANPRQMERVPAGAEFDLKLVLNIFTSDDEDELLNTVCEALKLVEDDYIGGSGSRGYGQVLFSIKTAFERDGAFYRNPAQVEGRSVLEQVQERFKHPNGNK